MQLQVQGHGDVQILVPESQPQGHVDGHSIGIQSLLSSLQLGGDPTTLQVPVYPGPQVQSEGVHGHDNLHVLVPESQPQGQSDGQSGIQVQFGHSP